MVLESVFEMVRVRIFCTLRQDLVQWLDEQVKSSRFRNRSHGIEFAVLRLKEEDEKARAGR
jgi:Arc/MetJ-type ribon-helix-helix transcriptional regulator